MAFAKLRRDEQIGLTLAIALHAALFAVLVLRPSTRPVPEPQRISVTLSGDTGLTAAAPTHEDASADTAPTMGAPPPPSAPAPAASPPPPRVVPLPVEAPVPEPRPVTVAREKPEPVAPPKPVHERKPVPAVRPKPEVVEPPEPARPARAQKTVPHHQPKVDDTIGEAIAAATPARPAHKHEPSVKDWSLAFPATREKAPVGGSRIGNDFLKGVAGGKASGKAQVQGAATIGPEVRSALSGALTRQLKPKWLAPEGVDADQLVTVLTWDLNPDGSLADNPRVLRQEGITESNKPQAPRHAEQAIRAVRLAAPFQLPPQYYSIWKHVAAFRFDRNLSQ